MVTAHTDVVGSLLRPPDLLQAREQYENGQLTPAEFKLIEDAAVDAAIALQEQAGIDVVTDGEMRRLSFQSGLPDAVDGFGEVPLDAYLWGDWHGADEVGDRATERPPRLGVRAPLRRRRHIAAEELTYLRGRTTRIPKITLTSPSLYANLWSPDISRDAYPTLDGFLEDVVAIMCDEVRELARLGATYLQLDAPHYPLLIDPATRAFYEAQGWTLERWLDRGIELDNAVIDARPASPSASTCAAATRAAAGWCRAATTRSPSACSVASRRPAAARVRRRAVGLVRAAADGAGRQDGGAGPGHDQDGQARDGRRAGAAHPRGGRVRRPRSGWRSRPSAGLPHR